jgi:uncharacterized protein (DUF58 family)
MPVPTRRWFVVAAALAVLAPLSLWWSPALQLLIPADAAWLALFAADWALARQARPIDVAREPPAAFSAGRAAPVRYRWRHGGRRTVTIEAREALPEPLVQGPAARRRIRVGPGPGTLETLWLQPAHRGCGDGGAIWFRAMGPLGLAWSQARIERPWTATVFPVLTPAALRALPAQARRREAGLRDVRNLGDGRAFETLREWVPGDDTRIIDWKATARRGKVMARQYEDERRQQVLIVIDAGRMLTAEVAGKARLESVIDAALQLAWAAVDHDDNVGLFVFADTIQQWIPPRRGRRALSAVLLGLAAVEGRLVEPDYPAAFAYLAARNRKRALTVFFTDVIDRAASGALLSQAATLRPRHLPLAVTLRNPELESLALRAPLRREEAFERAAAEELMTSRATALAEMRGRGVLVLDVPPDRAAKGVVDRYTELKRRGML